LPILPFTAANERDQRVRIPIPAPMRRVFVFIRCGEKIKRQTKKEKL